MVDYRFILVNDNLSNTGQQLLLPACKPFKDLFICTIDQPLSFLLESTNLANKYYLGMFLFAAFTRYIPQETYRFKANPQEMKTECDILAENDHPFILPPGLAVWFARTVTDSPVSVRLSEHWGYQMNRRFSQAMVPFQWF